MGLLSRVIGGPAIDAVSALGAVFDQLFTSDSERAQAAAIMEKIRQHPTILQAEITKIEASHRSVFVAGWRPFIGWVCGIGLFWAFVGHPVAQWIIAVGRLAIDVPMIMTDHLLELVMAMLGLGGLRSLDKLRGRSR